MGWLMLRGMMFLIRSVKHLDSCFGPYWVPVEGTDVSLEVLKTLLLCQGFHLLQDGPVELSPI